MKIPDVTNWIDVLRTHAARLRATPAGTPGRADVTRLADDVDRAMSETGPLLARVDEPTVAIKVIGQLRRIDHRVANAAVQANADAEDASRREQRGLLELHGRFTWLVGGLVASSALLVALLLRQCLMLGRAAGRLGSLAQGLEVANRDALHQTGLFDAALSNMGQGLCMLSADGRIIVHNGRLLDILAPGEALGADVLLSDLPRLLPGTALAGMAEGMAQAVPGVRTMTVSEHLSVSMTTKEMPGGGMVVTFEDVTQRARVDERVAFLAHHDDLTGLMNRRRHSEVAEAVLDARSSEGFPTVVMAVDLDGFKEVNDTFGHHAGDAVLREVAWRMRDEMGQGDVLARLGGDEFAVIHPTSDAGDNGADLAARIIATVSKPIVTASGKVSVGASVGISRAPADGTSAAGLMKSADMALYVAKQSGRGQAYLYDAGVDEEHRERRSLTQDLRGVAGRGELVLHYQPIVDAGTDEVILYEALVRWNHPTRGTVPPGSFIALAEDTGDIVEIGEWVLREACRTALSWPAGVGVAVNLSAVQFTSANVVETVAKALADAGLPPSRLEIEVTEGVLLKDTAETLRILRSLKALGVKIAMDDFGTGYASLSYLQRFPFDKIKIDQSFVRGMGDGDSSSHIVTSMTGLAGQLNLVTCAEGVETLQQAKALAGMGCKQLQGYWFGRPEPAKDLKSGDRAATPPARVAAAA